MDDNASIKSSVAVLEHKHTEHHAAIGRAHKRCDEAEGRLRTIELKIASQLWIERSIWVAASAAVSYFLAR